MTFYSFGYTNTTTLTSITFEPGFVSGSIVELEAIATQLGDGEVPITMTGLAGRTFILRLAGTPISIKQQAFYKTNIIGLELNSTAVNEIGENSFGESKLESITLPDASYGANVFKECLELRTVTFLETGAAFTKIASGMFYGCPMLESIVLPTYITEIESSAFESAGIENLELGNITKIGINSFKKCSLQNLTLPETLTNVGTNAFSECVLLTKLSLPKFSSPCEFGESVFSGCVSLFEVTIGGGFKDNVLPTKLCYGCSLLKTLTFDTGCDVVTVGESAFEGCTALNKINFLSESITTFEIKAFFGCGFSHLILPEHVSVFGEDVFGQCLNLTQLVIDCQTPTFNGNAFKTQPNITQLIFTSKLSDIMMPSDKLTLKAGGKFYVFKDEQRLKLLDLNPMYEIITKPYYDRNFVNHKSIYTDEHDPLYVMYTLESSGNTFNDCTFYFKSASSTTSVVVITDQSPFTNCVKMYAAIADVEGKTISRIYLDGIWKYQSSNGIVGSIDEITPNFILENNFECESVYDGRELSIDASSMSSCDMFALSNLTKMNKVYLNNLGRVKLTSMENVPIDIVVKTGSPIFEVNDIDSDVFKIEGNCTLVLENTLKTRLNEWSIEAPRIVIHELGIEYVLFKGQKNENDDVLTKIECNVNKLINFVGYKTLQLQLIENMNEEIFAEGSLNITASYYSSGWSM